MKNKIAVITGGSGGLGKEFAKLLLNEQILDEIWIISRNKEKLNSTARELDDKIRIFSADLSDLSMITEFEKTVKLENPEILYLINNAGYAKFCSYEDLSISESADMINLNCTAVVTMCTLMLPYMPSGSHIINVSSQASFQPLPYMNLYAASKAFVRNYSRALNVELKDKNIVCTAVCPGWMNTDFYKRAEIGAKKGAKRFIGMVSPEKVAERALKDAEKGKDISVYSLLTKFSHAAAKFLPQRLMMKLWLIQQDLK